MPSQISLPMLGVPTWNISNMRFNVPQKIETKGRLVLHDLWWIHSSVVGMRFYANDWEFLCVTTRLCIAYTSRKSLSQSLMKRYSFWLIKTDFLLLPQLFTIHYSAKSQLYGSFNFCHEWKVDGNVAECNWYAFSRSILVQLTLIALWIASQSPCCESSRWNLLFLKNAHDDCCTIRQWCLVTNKTFKMHAHIWYWHLGITRFATF